MLDLDRETFLAQYVTVWLAHWSAHHYDVVGEKPVAMRQHPVGDAIVLARQAWCSLLAADVVMPYLG